MLARTRCYPHGTFTPLLALLRNAQSSDLVLGPMSMAQWMEFWRPRVTRAASPYHRGLRTPTLTLALVVEHALVSMSPDLETCRATSEAGVYAWVSVQTARAVLAQHLAHRATATTATGRTNQTDVTHAA